MKPSIHAFILNQTTRVHIGLHKKHTNHTYTKTNKIKENLHEVHHYTLQVKLQNTLNKNIVTTGADTADP